MTIAVTDHAVERYLQRVRGVLDARPEIAGRVRRAWEAGRIVAAERGTVHVRDLERRDLVYVCVLDQPRDELVVVTLWEEGPGAAVPRRFTDALRPRRSRRGGSGRSDLGELRLGRGARGRPRRSPPPSKTRPGRVCRDMRGESAPTRATRPIPPP